MSRTFRIAAPGYENRVLGIWHGREDGRAKAAFEAAAAAVRSAEDFALALGRIASDENLSPKGRIEPARTHLKERQREIERLAKLVEEGRTAAAARRSAALAIPKADPTDAVTDAAIAGWMRGLDDRARFEVVTGMRLGTATPRLIEAVVRLPPELLGINRAQHASIIAEHVRRADPEGAEAIEEETEAFDNAAEVVAEATKFLASGAPATRHGKPVIHGLVEDQPLRSLDPLRAGGDAA